MCVLSICVRTAQVAGFLALSLSALIIALSWLVHRPLASAALLVAIACSTYVVRGGGTAAPTSVDDLRGVELSQPCPILCC